MKGGYMLIRVVPILAALFALMATINTASAVPSGAPLLQLSPTPVLTSTDLPTSTAIPTITPPATPTVVTPTVAITATSSSTALPLPDLGVLMTTTVAGAGTTTQQVTHNIEVRNFGGAASGLSTI